MLCISIKPKSDQRLIEMVSSASLQGGLIEIRLDALGVLDTALLERVIDDSTVPIMLTLRSVQELGEWKGSEREMQEILMMLAALDPDYLDIEYHIDRRFVQRLQDRFPNVQVILSYHNGNETPADLEGVLQSMRNTPAHLYKIATTACDTLDALRVLQFSKQAGDDVLALAMGEDGQITRILGPVVGNRWTYASLTESAPTAVGQLSAQQLEDIYHHSSLSQSTVLCGLIGNPVTYSVGEIAHNAVYRQLGIDAVYVKMRTTAEQVEECLSLAASLGFRGLSVTIPLKEKVQPFLSSIDSLADSIGAVNTLTFCGHKIVGSNTDAAGALDAIENHLSVKDRKVVLIGAGGACRALAFEAKHRGAGVVVLARRLEQAQNLQRDLGITIGTILDPFPDYDVLVNTTPNELPFDKACIVPGKLCMDLKNRPRNTLFLQTASQLGCPTIFGIEMFTRQAVQQLKAWFGDAIDPDSALEALKRVTEAN